MRSVALALLLVPLASSSQTLGVRASGLVSSPTSSFDFDFESRAGVALSGFAHYPVASVLSVGVEVGYTQAALGFGRIAVTSPGPDTAFIESSARGHYLTLAPALRVESRTPIAGYAFVGPRLDIELVERTTLNGEPLRDVDNLPNSMSGIALGGGVAFTQSGLSLDTRWSVLEGGGRVGFWVNELRVGVSL